jgi:hypothetical protein
MDWNVILQYGVTPLVVLIAAGWLIQKKYIYLGREYDRETKRADDAELQADKYENLLLKGRNIVADAASSHERLVDELIEVTRRHGGEV